jgi:hypothetical protein
VTLVDRQGIFFHNHDKFHHRLRTLNEIERFSSSSLLYVLCLLLVYFVVRTFDKGQEENNAVKRLITFTLEQHVREHPGERLVILFDLSRVGVRQIVSHIERNTRQ